MIRRRYSNMGFYYGVIQRYDFFGDGTGGYLVNFSDGDVVHLSADDVNASLLSRHDQLAYCERRLHPDPTTSWTGVAPLALAPALSGTKRPLVTDNTQPDTNAAPKQPKTRGGRRKRGATSALNHNNIYDTEHRQPTK